MCHDSTTSSEGKTLFFIVAVSRTDIFFGSAKDSGAVDSLLGARERSCDGHFQVHVSMDGDYFC